MRTKKFYISQRLSHGSIVIGRFSRLDDRNQAFNENQLWKKGCFCGIDKDIGC